jgi:hypothetical protein
MGRPGAALNRRAADRVRCPCPRAPRSLGQRARTFPLPLAQRRRSIACMARHQAKTDLTESSSKRDSDALIARLGIGTLKVSLTRVRMRRVAGGVRARVGRTQT